MRSRNGVCLAAALAMTSVLFSACGGGGGNHGGTVPRPTNETLIQCGIPISASLMQTAGTPIDLSNAEAVQHFQIEMIDPATTRITITVDSTTGNADLYIGIPGTPLGDLNNANFYFSSIGTGPTDSITIDQTGCIDGLGIENNTYTLSDFLGGTVDPIFAVASVTAGASYDVRIDCLGPPIDSLQCGVSISASLSRMAGTPIDLSNTDAVQHYQIPLIDPTTKSITITVDSTAGNADLHLGMPGTLLGDVNNASYYFSSTELGPTDSITIDDTGCINEFGIASPTFTL
ncbi:MAG: hypothetical protein O6952_07000, partial [Planctomycetota bacterium]|nr:hypothetical protein [Planctomycetota bacterium]